ncbi:MAG: hypothetical protein ACYDCN_15070 [Bacteroidia bacterium]
MYTSFHIKASELDETFIKGIKVLFKSKRITISVEEEMDETAYLLSTTANRKHLEDALKSKEGFEVSADSWVKYRKSKNAKDLNFKKVSL